MTVTDTFTILVDSREQDPYVFGAEDTEEVTLEYGDYTVKGFEDTFAIERKSLDDLANCVGSDRERFEAQVFDAHESLDEYIIQVDAPRWHVYDYQDDAGCPHYFSQVHPNSVIGTVEKWPMEFRWVSNHANGAREAVNQLEDWWMDYTL